MIFCTFLTLNLNFMKALYCLLIFVTISHLSFAQVRQLSPDQNPGKGTIEEFEWLVGYWVGTGLGGDCEEVWKGTGTGVLTANAVLNTKEIKTALDQLIAQIN